MQLNHVGEFTKMPTVFVNDSLTYFFKGITPTAYKGATLCECICTRT